MQMPVAEAKAQFAELLRRAAAGEVIEITRYGRTVARLMPPEARPSRILPSHLYGVLPRRSAPDPGAEDWTESELLEMFADHPDAALFGGAKG